MTDKERKEASEYNDALLIEIRKLCAEHKTSIPKIEQALGYGNGSISGWNKAVKKAPRERIEAIADYFGVPVETLLKVKQSRQKVSFYEKFIQLCEAKGVAPTRAALDIDLSKATPSKWKNGSVPEGETLVKLAQYFNVDISELVDQEEITSPAKWQIRQALEAAFWNGDDELTSADKDALWADVEEYIKFKTMQRKKSKK